MPQLQRALDREWQTFRLSEEGRQALARWAAADVRYLAFRNLGELRDHFERRDSLDSREALMADLLQRSPDDPAAQRVLLASLRPGLVRLTRRASAFWGAEEAESIVVTAALERLNRPTATQPNHVAAGVLGWVWSAVWERRRRERTEEEFWGRRTDPDALHDVEAAPPNVALGEVMDLVTEAVRSGVVPPRGARLVILHWLHGYSNRELAELDGLRPCTIRKHRRDAEIRLAEFAA
jgi:hypothetical protein